MPAMAIGCKQSNEASESHGLYYSVLGIAECCARYLVYTNDLHAYSLLHVTMVAKTE